MEIQKNIVENETTKFSFKGINYYYKIKSNNNNDWELEIKFDKIKKFLFFKKHNFVNMVGLEEIYNSIYNNKCLIGYRYYGSNSKLGVFNKDKIEVYVLQEINKYLNEHNKK